MQGLMKLLGWQSTTAGTENKALTWLKMRMWDLVLVDNAFAPSIATFREWEAKRWKTPQARVTLMAETVDATMVQHIQPPSRIDLLAAKPVSLAALDKFLIHQTFFDLNSAEIKFKANNS